MVRAAQAFCVFGLIVGLSIPYSVIREQKISERDRKQGIVLDKARTARKLTENPSLQFKTTLDIVDSGHRNPSSKGP
jgi:hypothetical protein